MFDAVVFFPEEFKFFAHKRIQFEVKSKNAIDELKQRQANKDKAKQVQETFKKLDNVKDLTSKFSEIEYTVFQVFDRVPLILTTTKEFPLDIVCTLDMGQPQDLLEKEQEGSEKSE